MASNEEVRARIQLANEDWNRLKEDCPKFPLQEEMLSQKLPFGDGTKPRCERITEISPGYWLEKAYCYKHSRMEFSETWPLFRRAVTEEEERIQRRVGRWLVALGVLFFPLGGFQILSDLSEDGGAAPYLMRAGGSVRADSVHTGERELAGWWWRVSCWGWAAVAVAAFAVALFFIISAY